MFKKGDTLIEVCIAIGIFSLIAIGVAAVMSSGVAGSQTALETTLSREEIDAQADALRFIHESRMREQNDGYKTEDGSKTYTDIWNTITEKAISAKESNISSVVQYNPATCMSLYNNTNPEDPDQRGSIEKQNGFIINIRNLDKPDQALKYADDQNNKNLFRQAQIYPRLIYEPDGTLSGTEGLYIVAVKDKGTQMIVDDKNTTSTSAYYDFYIRSCWYGTDADRPTAISTVIRLYDPPAVTTPIIRERTNYIRFVYVDKSNPPAPILNFSPQYIEAGETKKLAYPDINHSNYRFKCWSTVEGNCSDGVEHYNLGDSASVPAGYVGQDDNHYLYAVWDTTPYTVTYSPNGGSAKFGSNPSVITPCPAFGSCEKTKYTIPANYLNGSVVGSPDTNTLSFAGWSLSSNGAPTFINAGTGRQEKATTDQPLYELANNSSHNVTFYAIWKPYYWVDVNVFKDKVNSGTSGYEGFAFDVLIDGAYAVDERFNPPKIARNQIDFYTPLPNDSKIRVQLYKNVPSGYKLRNLNTLCGILGPTCTAKDEGQYYVVEFMVDGSAPRTLDSSNHNSLKIEPLWTK